MGMNVIVPLLSAAMGAVLVIVSAARLIRMRNPAVQRVLAVITDIRVRDAGRNTKCFVYVTYELDGTARTARLDVYRSGMTIGGRYEVLVNPKKPGRAMLDSAGSWIGPLVGGILFLLLALLLFLR